MPLESGPHAVIVVTPQELRALVREAVAEVLADGVARPAESPSAPANDTVAPLPEYLTTREAADFLRSSTDTLERLRSRFDGPPFKRVGRRVLYPLAGLREYGRRK